MALRNLIHRRQHKERAQPAHRKKLGLLEKHKDYVVRARDHHVKRDRIKRLKEKAALRNEDEYYLGMVKAKTEKGVHIASRTSEKAGTGLTAMTNDVVALLKTQDAAYVRKRLAMENKSIDALKMRIAPMLPFVRSGWVDEREGRNEALEGAGLLQRPGKGKARAPDDDMDEDRLLGQAGKKTVFVDDAEQVRKYKPGRASSGSGSSADVESSEEHQYGDEERAEDEKAKRSGQRATERHVGFLVAELRARQVRLAALHEASQKLGLVRALMTNKGSSVVKTSADAARAEKLKDAVAKGKMTKNGLALPGNEDEDEDDETLGKRKSRSMFKFGKERKR